MPSSKELVLEPGEVLYREGDANDCGYIIATGEVILYHEVDGVRIDCERRGAGSIVGELSILTGRPRTVTVEVIQRCQVFRISADQIVDRFERLDPVLRACVDTSISFSARLTEAPEQTVKEVPLAVSTLRNADEMIERLRIEADILDALENGELYLVYQPIVRLEDAKVVGIEALMRWQHPTMGNIAPDRFIEIAEAMESIGKLTRFALAEACGLWRRMRALEETPAGFFVSVNVSGSEIGQPGFVDYLSFILDQHDMRPGDLNLEVTETALLQDPKAAIRNLERLRRLGCGISVDDFGTGYSNLAYLKKLPLTTLKIDRVFAGDAHINAFSKSIVRMLLELGRQIGVKVVAEGIESGETVAVLRDLGCGLAQGYHFYKPLTEAALFEVITGAERDQKAVG